MAKQKIYLVLTKKRYGSMSAKAAMKKPSTKANEIAIALDLDIPDALFEKPALEAKIKVDPVNKGAIPVTVANDIAKIIAEQLGVNVTLSVAGVNSDIDAKHEVIDSFGK